MSGPPVFFRYLREIDEQAKKPWQPHSNQQRGESLPIRCPRPAPISRPARMRKDRWNNPAVSKIVVRSRSPGLGLHPGNERPFRNGSASAFGMPDVASTTMPPDCQNGSVSCPRGVPDRCCRASGSRTGRDGRGDGLGHHRFLALLAIGLQRRGERDVPPPGGRPRQPGAGGVPRAGVVHRDPGRGLQAGPQHVAAFGEEPIVAINQQAHRLSLGDAEAEGPRLRGQPLHRHLPMVVLPQHETPSLRAEMPATPDASGAGTVRPSGVVRRRPALADDPGVQHQALHHERLVALEARSRRRHRLHDPILDAASRRRLAASAMPAVARRMA